MNSEEIRQHYRDGALNWAAQADSKNANKAFRKLHAFYKKIRDLPEGREALISLLGDSELPVRVLAATYVLPFAPELGLPILEAAEKDGGVMAIDAKYTLLSYHTGKLNLDW